MVHTLMIMVVKSDHNLNTTYFQRHIIAARCQKLSLRVPLDSIDLIGVALEGLDWPVLVQLADVDLLVCGAGGKTLLRLPENILSTSAQVCLKVSTSPHPGLGRSGRQTAACSSPWQRPR